MASGNTGIPFASVSNCPAVMKSIKKSPVTRSVVPLGGAASPGGSASNHSEGSRFTRLLVPTDFSDPSKKALDYAARFVEQFGARVSLIHIIEPVMSPDFRTFPLALDEDKMMESARQQLAHLARTHHLEHHLDTLIVRAGNPFHEITEAALEIKADLIIISTHGYTGLRRALLGSTAERVVRYAKCPVMTVR
jgi:universal stress protein A